MAGANSVNRPRGKIVSLERALSKMGLCSRSQAGSLIAAGKVRINGAIESQPQRRVRLGHDRIEVDGTRVTAQSKVYLVFNKPRGLVTTTSDEQGRPTVYHCLAGLDLPWLAPVGRLDKASEGLLLFTNDTEWAARIQSPDTHLDKVYHVQVDGLVTEPECQQMVRGITTKERDLLTAKSVRVLRQGGRNCWLEVILDEGKNREIRRMLEVLGYSVLRLIRVAIGTLVLGNLIKGNYRQLTGEEKEILDKVLLLAAPTRSGRAGEGTRRHNGGFGGIP